MLSRLYVHVVWTTLDREPTLDRAVAEFLSRFLPAIATQERAWVLELGLVRTHLHLLLRLHPTTSIPRLLQRMKGGSAVMAARGGATRSRGLRWAKSYSIHSVSPGMLEDVTRYVREQHLRHPDEAILGWPRSSASPNRSSLERGR